jgi:hypothetical protein
MSLVGTHASMQEWFLIVVKAMKDYVKHNRDTREHMLAKSDHELLISATSALDYVETIFRGENRLALSEPAQEFVVFCSDVLSSHDVRFGRNSPCNSYDEVMSIGSATALFQEANLLIAYSLTNFNADNYGEKPGGFWKNLKGWLKKIFKPTSAAPLASHQN